MHVEKKRGEIGARLVQCPWRSLRHLTQDTAISKTSVVIATRLLELEPYKTAIVHESPGMYVKQQIAFLESAVVWVIFTSKGSWPVLTVTSVQMCAV
jgi:hypothetical protein